MRAVASRLSRTPRCLAMPADTQSRYIEAAVNGVLIGTLYAPNGNPQPGPKFKYKLAWMERLIEHAAELYTLDAPVVLAGDYNVVPTDADIYPTKSYKDNALVQPEPRALFARLLDQGWIDAIRTLHPDAKMYTFWDYMRNQVAARRRPPARSSAAESDSRKPPRRSLASIVTSEAYRTRAITLRHGSCYAVNRPGRANRLEAYRNRCGRRLSGPHRSQRRPNADHC